MIISIIRLLKEVATLKVDKKINRGKTEVIQMTVGGDIFSEFPGTKVSCFSVHHALQAFTCTCKDTSCIYTYIHAHTHTKVYLRFNVTLPIVGTHQVFAETITVSPTPPTLKISGPGGLAHACPNYFAYSYIMSLYYTYIPYRQSGSGTGGHHHLLFY